MSKAGGVKGKRQYRHTPEMLARFKVAWEEGVTVANLAERFGIRPSNVHSVAIQLKLTKREGRSWGISH
jgi:hypothetical protein